MTLPKLPQKTFDGVTYQLTYQPPAPRKNREWEKPENLIRWKNTLDNRLAQPVIDKWLEDNEADIQAAVEYYRYQNNDRPWWQWDEIRDPYDPIMQTLRAKPAPPESVLKLPLPKVEQEVPTITGQQQEQAQPVAQPVIEPKNQAQSFMAALTQPGMLVQGLISGGMTTAITPGPLALKLAAGGASFYGAVSGKTGESIQSAEEWLANQGLPSMSHLLLYLDYPAEAIERSLGLISIGYGTLFEATKKTGRLFGANSGAEAVGDFIRNLPTAWNASHFTYEAMSESFGGGGQGLLDPAAMATTEGDRQLLDLYRRMQSGELKFNSIDEMNAYAMDEFGVGGLLSDLAGHMLLDPLNAVGAVSKLGIQGVAKARQALAKTPEALKAAKILELAAMNADSGAEAIRTYGTMLRSSGLLSTDEISKMGGVTRWLAQVTRAKTPTRIEQAMWGVKQGGTFVPTVTPRVSALNRLGGALIQGIPMTVLGYGLGGPIGAGVLGGFGAVKGYWRFLTPTSRAVEALDSGSMAIARILNHAGGSAADPDQAATLAVKWIKAMGADNKGLAREISMATLDSPEASIVPHMLQDVGEKLDTTLDAFKATRQQRTMLENIARGLGMTTDDVLVEMKTTDSAQALLRRYIDVAKTSTDTSAKSLFDQFNAKTLTGEGLQKAFLPFTRDNLPHNYETFMGQIYTMVGDHADKWASTYFGVKPDHLWGRIGRTIKNAQSAVLLGLNPSYLIQNTINNVVTAAVSGAFGLRTSNQIDNFWTGIMGVKPMRLSAGVGISGAGEDLLTGWSTRNLRGKAMDSGIIGKLGDAFGDLTQQMPMTRMSAAVERESSRQVYTAATIDAYRRMKRIGAGIEPMDRRLEGLLNGIEEKNGLPKGTLGEIIYHAIMSGDSREAIEKRLFGQVAKRQVDAFISQLADQVGLSEGTLHSTLEQTGTLQFLRDRLSDDYTPEEVIKTFNDLQRHMVENFDDMYRKEVEGRAQYAADKVSTEGVQGLVDIVYDQAGSNLQRRLQGLANWEHFWERIGSADRRQKGVLVRDQFEIENANWQRWWTWNESTWLGISKALGVESPVSRTLLKNTKELSDSWLMAHTERNRLYREHFEQAFATPQERSAHWQQTKEAVRKVMDDAFTREIDINTRIGEQFTDLLVQWAEQAKGAEYGVMVRQASEAWYTSLNSVLQKIGQDVGKFYDDVGKLKNQNEKNAAWVKFNEEHRIPQFKDIWTAQVDGIQGVYKAINEEPPAAVMPEEPPRPPRPPEQPQQQEPIKPAHLIPEQPVEPRPEITPEQRATRAEVLEIANQYDNLKTYEVDDAGMIVNKGEGLTHPKHVENILKNPKYGGDPGNTLDNVAPGKAKEILDNYQAFKREAQEAQMRAEMPEPEPVPEPVKNLETFSDRWQAEQAVLDHAALLREGIDEGDIEKAKNAYDRLAWSEIPNDLKPRFERLRKAEDAILNLRLLDLPDDIREDATAILNTMYHDVSNGEVVKRSIIPDTGSEGVKVTGGGTTYPKWYGEEGYNVYKGAYYWKIENGKKVKLGGKSAVMQALDDMRSGLVTRNALSQRLARIWWEEFQADGQLFAYLIDLTPKKTIRDLTRAEIKISKLIDGGWLDQASEELSEFGGLVDEIYGSNVPADVSTLFDELLDSWSRKSAELEAENAQAMQPPKVIESDVPVELRPHMEEIQQREELQVWAEEMQDDLDRFIKPAEQAEPPKPAGPQIAAQFGNVTFYRAPNGDLWRVTGEPGPVDSTTGMPGGARWEAPAHLADQAIETFTGEKKTNVMPGGQAEMFGVEETMPLFTGTAMNAQESLFRPVEQPRTELMPGFEEAYKPGMKGSIEGGEAAGAGPLLPEVQTQWVEMSDELQRKLNRAWSLYSKGLPNETGKGLTASLENLKKSIAYFISAGVPEDHHYIKSLMGLLDEYKPAINQVVADFEALVEKYTAEGWRVEDIIFQRFAGDHNLTLRQDLIAAFTGTKPPKSKAGVTVLRAEYLKYIEAKKLKPDEPLFQGTPTPTRTIPLRDLPTVRQSRETLRQQWEATGKYRTDELDAGMAILDAFALSQQRWTGMTPREWYARAFGEVRLGDASDEISKALAQRGKRNIDTPEFARWFDGSQVVDEQGKPLVVYHGSQRVDRIAQKGAFLKKRATSGPMSYFTNDPEIASGYATGKQDTSLQVDSFENMFIFKLPGQRSEINLAQLWYYLDDATKERLRENLPLVNYKSSALERRRYELEAMYPEGSRTPEIQKEINDLYDATYMGDTTVVLSDFGMADESHWNYVLKNNRFNPIMATVEVWLSSGEFIGEEQRFMEVLRAAGLKLPFGSFRFEGNYAEARGVVPVYLNIKRPLDIANIPEETIAALEAASKKTRKKPSRWGADYWDKNLRDPAGWVEEVRNNPDSAFTSIPDWATATLKALGYDGIKDAGAKVPNKNNQTIWIPFEENQVKSVFNRGTWSSESNKILFQDSAPVFYSYLDRVVQEIPQERMTVGQLRGILKAKGVKADELKWTGLDDLLDERGDDAKITRTELAQYMRENQVEIKEVHYGKGALTDDDIYLKEGDTEWIAPEYETDEETGEIIGELSREAFREEVIISARRSSPNVPDVYYIVADDDAGSYYVEELQEAFDSRRDAWLAIKKDYISKANKGVSEVAGYPEYSNITIKGGENYRELLLTMPENKRVRSSINRMVEKKNRLIEIATERAMADPEYLELRRKMNEARRRVEEGDYSAEAKQARESAEAEVHDRWRYLFEEIDEFYSLDEQIRIQQGFETERSPHWSHDNVLAHIRFDERVDADGKRVLFINEIQSDWHQTGRKKGYRRVATEADLPEGWKIEHKKLDKNTLKKEFDEAGLHIGQNYAGYFAYEGEVADIQNAMSHAWNAEILAMRDALGYPVHGGDEFWIIRKPQGEIWGADPIRERALAQLNILTTKSEAVNPAPFSKTWPELTMKRMIRWAAENDYDRIAFPTGPVAARIEGHQLVENIDTIRWLPERNEISYRQRGDSGFRTQTIEAGKNLDDYIGADAAKQMREMQPRVITPDMYEIVKLNGPYGGYSVMSNAPNTRRFSSGTFDTIEEAQKAIERMVGKQQYIELNTDDIAFGGENMRWFYDRDLINVVDKYVKKWGARVGETKISSGERPVTKYQVITLDTYNNVPQRDWNIEFIGNTREEASRYIGDKTKGSIGGDLNYRIVPVDMPERIPVSVHSFDVTQAMRDSVMQGQPLFQGPKGAVQFGNDMRAVIYAFQSADISTFLHESAHVFRRWLPDEEMNVVTAWLRDDHKLVVEHFGGAFQGEDEIVRQAEELYAQGFEQYIREGRAPTQGLQAHFEKLKQWLAAIYARLSGNPIVKITPEMRQHFDRILSGTDEVAIPGKTFDIPEVKMRGENFSNNYAFKVPDDGIVPMYHETNANYRDILEKGLLAGDNRAVWAFQAPQPFVSYKYTIEFDANIGKNYESDMFPAGYKGRYNQVAYENPQWNTYTTDFRFYGAWYSANKDIPSSAIRRIKDNETGQFIYVRPDLNKYSKWFETESGPARLMQNLDQTQQPAFKQWFGNSKVVDDQGKPLLVYHGTKSENEFTTFNPGSHFGTSNQADAVLGYRRTFFEPGSYTPRNNPNERIIPVYLKIENPLRLRDLGGWDEQKIGFELDRLGYHDVGEKLRQTFEKSQALLDKIISSDTADVLRLYDEGIALRNANIKAALDELGYDGIVYKNVWEGEGDSYLVFDPTRIKSAFNRGTFDPNDPNILYQHGGQVEPLKKGDDPEPTNMPLGTVDRLQGPPTTQMQEEAFNEYVWPILRQLEGMMRGREANIPKGVMGTIDPKSMVEVRKYLGKVYGQIADTKHMAIKLGEQKRDFALLNYSKRYEWDNVLGTIFPYEFWYTRSAMNWALRALERPAIFANYARTREAVRRMNSDKDIPTRLRNKIRLPMPYMQSERGAGVYVDPLRQLFPIDQLAMPFDRLWQQETLIDRRAQYILLDWQANEEITPAQAKDPQIIAKAKAMAEEQLDAEISNPLDLASTITGVSLPVQWGYNIARKKPDNIGQLPITRFVQSLTALAGANQGRGYNMEGPLRRKLGMVEQSKYDQYFVERELARMVADGVIDVETAKRAMMDKQGEAYIQAQARVAKVGAYRNLASVVALDTFPESEAEIRSLRAEYEKSMEAREKGNKNAVQDFFDKYPEYEAQTYVGDDPEERLRQYLKSQVWEQYMGMDDLHKRQAREQLGNLFNDAFLNKETRSYDSISTKTLTAWATQLGAKPPEAAPGIPQMQGLEFAPAAISATYQEMNNERDRLFPGIYRAQETYFNLPEGRIRELFLGQHPELSKYWSWRDSYLAENPQVIPYAIGEDNKLAGVDPGIQALVYQYRADRAKLFPDVFKLQDAYFTLESSAAKKGYLAAHPELKRYWDWQKDFMNAYPQAIPYIKSTESIAKAVLGEDYTGDIIPVDVASWPPALVRQVLGYYTANQPLTAGAKTALRAEWKKTGSTETFNDWLDLTLRQQLTGMGY